MPRRYLTVEERRIIFERANGRCEYYLSRMDYALQSFEGDHIKPDSKGGLTELENLASACGGCNKRKYNKIEALDPLTQELVPLYHPRQQKWIKHFAWSEDFTQIIGLTAIGRATVESLNLNRLGVVNIRTLLITVGKHPPKM